MGLVRILVDGYSLLHAWPEMAAGKARYSSAAREELIHQLRQYGDAIGTPITVVFDGGGPAPSVAVEAPSTRMMEIIFSKAGQTADDIIERVAARLVSYGEVLVVTNDYAERDTVVSAGGNVCSCESFISTLKGTLGEFGNELKRYNRDELKRYRKM